MRQVQRPGADRATAGCAASPATSGPARKPGFTEPGELIDFLAGQPAGERDTDAPAVDVPASAGAPADPPAGPALGRDRP
jgi:hypothetical protein